MALPISVFSPDLAGITVSIMPDKAREEQGSMMSPQDQSTFCTVIPRDRIRSVSNIKLEDTAICTGRER